MERWCDPPEMVAPGGMGWSAQPKWVSALDSVRQGRGHAPLVWTTVSNWPFALCHVNDITLREEEYLVRCSVGSMCMAMITTAMLA